MRTWIRRTLIGSAAIVAMAAAALFTAATLGERKRGRQIEVAAAPVPERSDAAAVERGDYLYRSRGCADCHGKDGAGGTVIDDGKGMRVHAPDITPAGVAGGYQAVDWVRTIRHGVKPDGRPTFIMPSEDYNRLTDDDLAALIAHLRRLPRGNGAPAVLELPLPVMALYGVGLVQDAAEKIDHRLPPAQPVAEGVSVAHGAYVVNSCIGCHGARLEGGRIPGAPPDWPAAARLAGDGSVMSRYPEAQSFAAMMKNGKRPDGSAISSVMPFASLREMSEVDVRALHLYLTRPER